MSDNFNLEKAKEIWDSVKIKETPKLRPHEELQEESKLIIEEANAVDEHCKTLSLEDKLAKPNLEAYAKAVEGNPMVRMRRGSMFSIYSLGKIVKELANSSKDSKAIKITSEQKKSIKQHIDVILKSEVDDKINTKEKKLISSYMNRILEEEIQKRQKGEVNIPKKSIFSRIFSNIGQTQKGLKEAKSALKKAGIKGFIDEGLSSIKPATEVLEWVSNTTVSPMQRSLSDANNRKNRVAKAEGRG